MMENAIEQISDPPGEQQGDRDRLQSPSELPHTEDSDNGDQKHGVDHHEDPEP